MVGKVVALLSPQLMGVLVDELRGRHLLVESSPLAALEDGLLQVNLVIPVSCLNFASGGRCATNATFYLGTYMYAGCPIC